MEVIRIEHLQCAYIPYYMVFLYRISDAYAHNLSISNAEGRRVDFISYYSTNIGRIGFPL